MADVVIAFGVESMSRIPMGGHDFTPNPEIARTRPDLYLGMGLTAENLAARYAIGGEPRRPLRDLARGPGSLRAQPH